MSTLVKVNPFFSKNTLLYSIILAEGYVVLSTELLAIRLLMPFVGNGTETLSIIIAAVLMPLAIGYYKGGQVLARSSNASTFRNTLVRNMMYAASILVLGLSYLFLEYFFSILEHLGVQDRLIQTALYCSLFLVYPIFLLGQTVPLVSHFFRGQSLSKMTGYMLFCSTLGSFLGAMLSTLVLMSLLGVHDTALITVLILVVLCMALHRRWRKRQYIWLITVPCLMYAFNHPALFKSLGIVQNNAYSLVRVIDVPTEQDARILSVNRSASSKYSPQLSSRFDYIQYIERQYIQTLPPKASVLVVGAGGFTLGLDDAVHQYTFVDVDPALKPTVERYFLKQPLASNKHFRAVPARAFFRNLSASYDLIILDAYNNHLTIPTQLITQEFFKSVKAALRPGGVMVFNAIASPDFKDRYSIKLDNTLHSVFPHLNRQVIMHQLKPYENRAHNIMYSYLHQKSTDEIYTDQRNTYFLDRHTK